MRLTLFLLTIAFGLLGCTKNQENKSRSAERTLPSIQELEQKAFSLYQENPEEAVPYFKELAQRCKEDGITDKAAITYLNTANIFDEHLAEKDSALLYAEISLGLWQERKDSLQQANLYKYVGLLKGQTGKLDEGIEDLQKAIFFYRILGFPEGLAVAERNLAKVFFLQKEYAKTKALLSKSTHFWRQKGDQGRVFGNNLLGIELYRVLGEKAKEQRLLIENRTILESSDIPPIMENRFLELESTYQEEN
jgi:tetratricopeptide (TPR) repeat protein